MEYKPGDLVRMKSSSVPVMTVVSVKDDQVTCMWMEKDGSRHEKREDTFPEVVLTKYKSPQLSARSFRG